MSFSKNHWLAPFATNKIDRLLRDIIIIGAWTAGYFAIYLAPRGIDTLVFEIAAVPFGSLLDGVRCIDKPYLTETGRLIVYLIWFFLINTTLVLWRRKKERKGNVVSR